MPADSPSPTIRMPAPEHQSRTSSVVRAAACISAAILVVVFTIQAYWAAGDAGPDFDPMLPPLVVAAVTTTWTLGGAVLLLARVGVLALPLPTWLLRVGPWVLAAFFGLLSLGHLWTLATDSSGDWQIDLQGPLLLLLAGLCIVVASEEPSK